MAYLVCQQSSSVCVRLVFFLCPRLPLAQDPCVVRSLCSFFFRSSVFLFFHSYLSTSSMFLCSLLCLFLLIFSFVDGLVEANLLPKRQRISFVEVLEGRPEDLSSFFGFYLSLCVSVICLPLVFSFFSPVLLFSLLFSVFSFSSPVRGLSLAFIRLENAIWW